MFSEQIWSDLLIANYQVFRLSSPTIFWHDYETWGANPQKDPACQFAGLRTDYALNPVDKPQRFFCQIPNDYLPHPMACLVTGITPQQSLAEGVTEAEFIAKVHQQFAQPNTCGAGFNSLRFDDEVTRYTLYRNFYDPYAREWQNGNSRWDIIDLVRACYALRPDGIAWPEKDDGSPTFKLEALSKANGIEHEDAHDALSDVLATIDVAKLVKTSQPKLYDYLFDLRLKKSVGALIDCYNQTPLVHISSKLPAQQGCCTWVVPVAYHPTNKNAVITLNLALDPSPLFDLDVEQIREKLYTPTKDLAEGEERLPLKLIHINKCPVLAPAKTLTQENAQRLGIDRQYCLDNLAKIKASHGLAQKLSDVFDTPNHTDAPDADHALYSGGFFSDHDRALMERLRQTAPEQLSGTWEFEDPRLSVLLFRYRARNFPVTLSDDETHRWQRHRQYRFLDPASPASISLEGFMSEIDLLAAQYQHNPQKIRVLQSLYQYAENL